MVGARPALVSALAAIAVGACAPVRPARAPPGAVLPDRGADVAGVPRAIRLPELLSADLFKQADVCSHARAHHPDKPLVLVAAKSHACDFSRQACLGLTRDLSDSCNRFVRERFAVYQTRLLRSAPDAPDAMQEQPAAWEMAQEWSALGPLLVVIEPRRCTRLGTVEPSGGMGKPQQHPASASSAAERFRELRRLLMGVPGVAERIGTGATEERAEQRECLRQPEPTVLQIWQALETQHGPVVGAGGADPVERP
jgi:hypothetical protein